MSPKVFKAIVLILVGLILASCQPAPSPTPPTATPLPAEVVISEIIPSDGAEITGNFLTVIWRTDPEVQGAVYWRPKGEEEYQRVEGTLTDRHQVTITGLESDQEYEFYVEAKLGEQTKTSEVRAFTVVPGLGFTQPLYEFNVERDYDQWAEVEVFNTDNRPHRLLVLPQADFPDLVVGFLGLGSRDEMFDLPGGETKLMRFIVFAQDATQEEYTFPIVLYNMDGREDISEVEDVPFATATVRVQVRIPRIDLQFEKIAEDPYTLAQTWQITNQGEYFADMAILPSPELEGRIYTIPSATHTEMHSGQSRDYIIVPFLDLGFQGLEGEVLVRGAGAEESFPVSFQVPEGKAVYIGFSQSGAGAGSSDSGCTNRGAIDTDLPTGPPIKLGPLQDRTFGGFEDEKEFTEGMRKLLRKMRQLENAKWSPAAGPRAGDLRPWVLQAYPSIERDNFTSSYTLITLDAIYALWHSDFQGNEPQIYLVRLPRVTGPDIILQRLSDPERAARWPWLTYDQQGHLVVAWESAAGNRAPEVAWSWSEDSGLTWSLETLLTNHEEGAYDPVPLFANGLLYMVWEDHRDGYGRVYFAISEDNGESFGPQRPISPSGQNIEWPWIDVDPTGTIHIVYEAKEGGIGQVYYTRSEDDGETFSAPVRLSTPGEDTGEPRIYVFPERDETVHVTYRAGNGDQSEVFYLQSGDGGETWSEPLQVTDDHFYSEYPGMTSLEDRLAITFNSNYHGVTDAEYFVFSEDNGATWGDLTRWPSRDEAVTAAWLEVNFQPRYNRRDFGQALQTTHISVNGQEVGTIVDQIIEGTYLFPVDLDLLNFWSMKDLAANRITVFTEVVNGAHYRRTANFRLLLDYRYLEVPVVASSQEEADRIAQGPLPNVNHNQPDIGLFANLVEPIPVQQEDSQEFNVRLQVFNLGQGPSSEITVRVFNGDPEKGGVEITDPLTLAGLEPGEETVINIPLTYISRFASATEYLTQVYIVASTETPDFYLTNNTHIVTFVFPERESPLAETDGPWTAAVPTGPTGTLVFTVYDTEGNVPTDAQILVYPEGDHTNSIAQSGDNPATLELPQGTYDILARHADLEQWVEGVVVRADEESEASAQFTLGTLTFTIRDAQGIITSDARILVYPRGAHYILFSSDDNPAPFSLPPGSYDILAIHRSLEQWVEGVSVRSGETTEAETTFQLGELEVTVKQRGIVKAYDLRVSIFPAGDHGNSITYTDDNPARFTLFPGEYDILVRLGEAEEWLEGIEVQTGEITEREVDFDIAPAPWPTSPTGQGNLAFTVYSSPGVEASVEEVTVYPAGDHRNWITYTYDNPAVFTLNPGTYDLQVELYGHEKWVTGLSVQQGKTEEETLTLSFGYLLFTTYQATGWEAQGEEVTVYPAGDHRNWITYTHDNPAPFTLLAGTYDVGVRLFGEEKWIPGLVVESGQTSEASTTFTFGRLTITVYESPGVQAESVEITIYPAGDHTNWITYSYSNPVTFPLLAGTYDVGVEYQDKEVWVEGVEVREGETTETEATFP